MPSAKECISRTAVTDILNDLREIHEIFGFVPRRELQDLADENEMEVLDVYAIAGSEPSLRLEPLNARRISLCFGTPWHACASPEILAAFERVLGVKKGAGPGRAGVALETFKCPGPCSGDPHVMLDGRKTPCRCAADVERIVKEENLA